MMSESSQSGSRDRRQRNSRRHQARILAMQIRYEADMTGHSTAEILVRTRNLGGTPDETLQYASDLLTGIRARVTDIHAEIEIAAPDYPVEGIAPIDRAILEIALFETLFGDDVPPRAAVNEAVGIAKDYGGDASARFVNGVLGEIIDRRHPESGRKRGTGS
jgi:transcription antitermination protein NusB